MTKEHEPSFVAKERERRGLSHVWRYEGGGTFALGVDTWCQLKEREIRGEDDLSELDLQDLMEQPPEG